MFQKYLTDRLATAAIFCLTAGSPFSASASEVFDYLRTSIYGGPLDATDGNRASATVSMINDDVFVVDEVRKCVARLVPDNVNNTQVEGRFEVLVDGNKCMKAPNFRLVATNRDSVTLLLLEGPSAAGFYARSHLLERGVEPRVTDLIQAGMDKVQTGTQTASSEIRRPHSFKYLQQEAVDAIGAEIAACFTPFQEYQMSFSVLESKVSSRNMEVGKQFAADNYGDHFAIIEVVEADALGLTQDIREFLVSYAFLQNDGVVYMFQPLERRLMSDPNCGTYDGVWVPQDNS